MIKNVATRIALLIFIILTIAANYKLLSLREIAFNATFETEKKIEGIAAKVRAGGKAYTPEQMADLLVVSNDRSPERYMYTFFSLFGIVAFNIAVVAYFLGYYFCWRKVKKNAATRN